MDLTKGAAIVKKQLDGYEMNIAMYGEALRYVLYYLANSYEQGAEISEEHLAKVCKDGVELTKGL